MKKRKPRIISEMVSECLGSNVVAKNFSGSEAVSSFHTAFIHSFSCTEMDTGRVLILFNPAAVVRRGHDLCCVF